ncbi:MAG: ATP phosphoribosyltransferase regulatory subunit [Anaerolineae bacterium]
MLDNNLAQNLRLPHGVTDLFFEQAAAKTEMERLLAESFQRWGYQRIIPPTFGYYESLSTGASPQLEDEMVRFFDREGRILALRPDMTIPTARVVGTKLYDQTLPLRFYYIGQVFRHVDPQAGWHREFTQAGLELIGAGRPEADAEVVTAAVAALQAIGMADFQINLGEVGYLQAVLNGGRLANDDLRLLEQAIDRKNDVELERVVRDLGLPEAAARAVRAIPHLCGDHAVLDEAARLAPNAGAAAVIDRFAQVYDLLRLEKVAGHIILDLGEVRSMAYYTGISFHGYVAGLGFPVCSGGRYDSLVARFGADLPAVGFAMGIERSLLVTAPAVDTAPHLVMPSCGHPTCHRLAAQARAKGLRVEVDVLGRAPAELEAYARAKSAHRVLVCMEDGASYTLSEAGTRRPLGIEQVEKEIAQWSR